MKFFKRRSKQTYFYIATWVMKDGRPRLTVISLRGVKDEARANQIAHDKLREQRVYYIHTTDTPDISEATREVKAKYFLNTGDLDRSTERAAHPNIESQ